MKNMSSTVLVEFHRQKLVHGDIQDINIMVKRDRADSKDLSDVILLHFDVLCIILRFGA